MKTYRLFDIPFSTRKQEETIEHILALKERPKAPSVLLSNAHVVVEAEWNTEFTKLLQKSEFSRACWNSTEPFAPGFLFGNEGQFDAHQRRQANEAVERTPVALRPNRLTNWSDLGYALLPSIQTIERVLQVTGRICPRSVRSLESLRATFRGCAPSPAIIFINWPLDQD